MRLAIGRLFDQWRRERLEQRTLNKQTNLQHGLVEISLIAQVKMMQIIPDSYDIMTRSNLARVRSFTLPIFWTRGITQ